jgi:PAS domain S-box-containing protein
MTALSSDWAVRAVDAALDAIVTVDHVGAVVQFNPAAERLFGYRREDVIGLPLADLIIPPDQRADHWAGLLRVVAGGEPRILDRRITRTALHRDGHALPVELTVTRISEAPPLFTGFIRDLSALTRAERRSSDLAWQLSVTERLAGVGTWELDLRSAAAAWSEGMYRMSALPPGGGLPGVALMLDTTHPDDRERIAALLTRVIERPETVPEEGMTVEYRALGRDGAVHDIVAHGWIERDEDGTPARWAGVAHDVTERRAAERGLHAHGEVAQALRDWDSIEEGVAGLLRRLGAALDFAIGSFWVHDATEDRLVCRGYWSAPDVNADAVEARVRSATYRPGDGAPGRAWESAMPVVVADRAVRGAPDADLRSEVAFPAVGADGPVAVLAFVGRGRRALDAQLESTLMSIGSALGRFLSRRVGELRPSRLTPRELEVLALAAEGLSGPEIARKLSVSPATIKTHFESIYAKLGVGDRAGAVALALRTGLIL